MLLECKDLPLSNAEKEASQLDMRLHRDWETIQDGYKCAVVIISVNNSDFNSWMGFVMVNTCLIIC